MPLSQSIRGKEATLLLAIDGEPAEFNLLTTDLNITEVGEGTRNPHLGETTSSVDIRHDGWDVSFTTEMKYSDLMDYLTSYTEAEKNSRAHPEITLTVLYQFRGSPGGVASEVYFDGVLRATERSHGGRDDYITQAFEGMFRERKQY